MDLFLIEAEVGGEETDPPPPPFLALCPPAAALRRATMASDTVETVRFKLAEALENDGSKRI